ncbi:hypothetical protein LTS18_002659 [Coniosporium uncinatum]|uniref:Uncharacterized protein n=1 Tax=Coniosporium uncinatum TaxID=93489 RepID=A0ACC3D7P4_9PEZI|nr:hypothetical protein LTS18_002659 [Coniosporium uncinatum]
MASFDASKLFSIKGMVYVITGGGSGLGETMALALNANGASKVFILGRREASLNKVAAQAEAGSIIPVVCDISSKDSLQAAVSAIGEQTPFVNVVIANGGVLGTATSFLPRSDDMTVVDLANQLWSTPASDQQSVMNINVLGSYNTLLAFVKLLDAGNKHPNSPKANGYLQSQFITISSAAAFIGAETVSYEYDTSKAAILHLTKMLAAQFAKFDIRVNCIAPGYFATEMTEIMHQGKDPSAPGSMPKSMIPATRSGSKEDLAGTLLYLTSRAGSFCTGTVIAVDGGMSFAGRM